MVVLVTGGAGYIGSDLIRELAIKFPDETIRVLDNMMKEKYVSFWNLNGKFELIEGDITKEDDLKRSMKDVETIFDLAGITNAPLSFEKKQLTMDVNVGGVKKTLKVAMDNGVKKYIYSGTASVYGSASKPVKEDFDCKPQSPYGESKLLAEKEIEKAIGQGFNATILRLGTVYGWSIGMRFDTVIDRFTYLACIGSPLTVWESAINERRPYVHIKDAVSGLIFPLGKKMNGIYNVLGQNALLGEVTDIIKEVIPTAKITITPASKSQSSYTLDDSKIKQLGFKTKYEIKDGVKEIRDKFSVFLR
ncbi:MAG: NAD(P)-dependent oxidoreductase [Nanoarchaeota archaeon]